MPTPPRTSLAEIVATARTLLESEGLDALTMQKVATAVGVRAPSLYKHVAGRAELVGLIGEDVVTELGRALDDVVTGDDPRSDLIALAHVFRDFARSHPEGYRLIFAQLPEEWRPSPEAMRRAIEPVLRTTSSLVGSKPSLDAARLLTAWGHGFVTMELAGAFRMDGDVDRAFVFGAERIVAALTSVRLPPAF